MTYHVIPNFGDGYTIKLGTDFKKTVQVPHADAGRLADLALHELDMDKCIAYLDELEMVDVGNTILRDALWEGAVATFFKCFQRSTSRFKLKRDDIFALNSSAAIAFDFFSKLRDKHIMHDENAYTQCKASAVLRPEGELPHVAGLVCKIGRSGSCDPTSRATMKRLALDVKTWCAHEYTLAEARLLEHLNSLPYATLDGFEDEEPYKPGQPSDIGIPRQR